LLHIYIYIYIYIHIYISVCCYFNRLIKVSQSRNHINAQQLACRQGVHRVSSGMLIVEFFTKEGKWVGNTWNETVLTVPPLTVFRAKSCATWPDGYERETLFVRVSLNSSEGELKPTW
jgi:hypothetical protein